MCDKDIQDLKHEIMRDKLATDLQLSLFVSASQSFKYESLLKPVSSCFKKADGEIDIEKIRKLIVKLPSLREDNFNSNIDHEHLNLLKTVVLSSSYRLTQVCQKKFETELAGRIDIKTSPNWIFQVDFAQPRQEAWERWKLGRNVFLAYHGSRFENFHSILNLGLHQHLNKTSLFGEGIYLSTEQTLSMHYSPSGASWSLSQLGKELSILALCEVIDHPNVKRWEGSKNSLGSTERGGVPEKYILVTNNELVRPRFLLVYRQPSTLKKNSSIWHEYKFVLCIGVYVILLAAIGLAKKTVL